MTNRDEAIERWRERWRQGTTPWDLGKAHPFLEYLIEILESEGLSPNSRWYVPGCGRAHEGAWLAKRGYRVLAEDLAPEAVAEARRRYGNVEGLELAVGDALRVPETQREQFTGIVDRAIWCALPPSLWDTYLSCCAQRLAAGGWLVALPFARLEGVEQGPPFAVDRSELTGLLEERFEIHRLEERESKEAAPSAIRAEWLCLARKRG